MPYKRKQPNATLRELVFHLDSASTGAPLTGQAFATTDLQLRKAGGGAYANCNAGQQAAVVEIGGGDYVYTFLAAELDTSGVIAFKVAKAGAVLWTTTDVVTDAVMGTVIAGTLTATAFSTDLADTIDNERKDSLVQMTTGALAGQVKKIGASSSAAGKVVTLDAAYTFTGPPTAGDFFEILNR